MRTTILLLRPILALILPLATPQLLLGQQPPDETSPWVFKFLPGSPLPVRLTANPQEPRTGIRKEIGSSHLKLDIGAGFDLLEVIPGSDTTSVVRFGADFFTYALSTSADGLRLQIDAVDGFFGGHLIFLAHRSSAAYTAVRLRVLHQSAHFLDGHMKTDTMAWRDNRPPNPYTRDFGELSAVRHVRSGRLDLQLFAGTSYATLVRPEDIQRWTFFGGGELGHEVGLLWDQPARLYAATYFSLSGVPTYVGTTTLEGGIRFGKWDGPGLRIYLEYHSGLEVFGQYYDVKTERWGVGFALDPW